MKHKLFWLTFLLLASACGNPQGAVSTINTNFHPGISGTIANYAAVVIADSPTYYWRLGDSAGPSLMDQVGGNTGTLTGVYTLGLQGAFAQSSATALLLSGGYFYGGFLVAGPNTFSEEVWFKTTTTLGGKILGFGASQTGLSGSYDRHIYMIATGQIIFGVYPGAVQTIISPSAYNNGAWHYVVATLSTSGMQLYIDGSMVASNPAVTTAQAYNGYWRGGYDSLSGWTSAPPSNNFAGTLEEAAIYMNYKLTPTQIANHYTAGLED